MVAPLSWILTLIAAGALACTAARAQSAAAPSPWASQTASGTGQVFQRGKLLIEWDPAGGSIAVYSAFTRQWHRAPLGGQAALVHANDWCLFQEGDRWTAFSAYRGFFEAIRLGPGAQLVNPSSQRNDSLAVVRDGDRVWIFSGFTGGWDALDAGPGALVEVQRHAVVVARDRQLWARSAWLPGWSAAATQQPVLALAADGMVGLAATRDALYGFSAQQGRWARTSVAGGAGVPQLVGDVAVWTPQGEVIGFSGLTGTFDRVAVPAAAPAVVDRQVAALPLGVDTLLYSAVTGRWVRHTCATVPALQSDAAVVVLRESGQVHAYSALTGGVATLPRAAAAVEVTRAVVSVVDGGGAAHLFSAQTGAWHPAPSGAIGAPLVSASGALLQSAGLDLWAFRAEDGSFVPWRTAAPATPHVDSQSAALGVSEADRAHAFDSRTGRWSTAALPGAGSPQVGQWRTNLVLARGQHAVGFAVQTGAWTATPLAAPAAVVQASSEVTLLRAGNQLWAYGAVPEVLGAWQFPAFRRIQAVGAPLPVWVRRAPGSCFVVAGPWAPNPVPWLGTGSLWLDPAVSAVAGWIAPADTATRGEPLLLPFVASSALRGTRWVIQGVVVGPGGGLRATEPCGLELW